MNLEKKAPVLSQSQFKQVVATTRINDQGCRNVALLYFSMALGLRAKEMSQLLVRDVLTADDRVKDEVLLTRSTTKGGKQRLIYLTNKDLLRISAHRGRHFRLIVDGVSAGSWTAFQSDRGRRFSEIVDERGCAQVIH